MALRKNILLTLLIGLFMADGVAQENALKRADRKYDSYAYIDAIAILEKVATKGYKNAEMFRKLGNAYYFNSDFSKAENAYRELFLIEPDQASELIFRYAQSLKSVGKYQEAQLVMLQFAEKAKSDQRAVLFEQDPDYLDVIADNSGRYSIEDAGFNSAASDFGAAVSGNQIVFSTARDTAGFVKRLHKWNNKAFMNLYTVTVSDSDSVVRQPEKFQKQINSRFHESTPAFSKDGKTMYFTRNNFSNGKRAKSQDNITLLKIYSATLVDGKWANIEELPFNSNQFSCAHPALSPDGKILYFVSDRPGTYGLSDIYKVSVHDDGSFGAPENLGTSINTPAHETFPFVSDENELYFSSDGHPGLGGLDIFVSKITKNGFGNVQNLGRPLNGNQDDFAYYINVETRAGYFSSNRDGGKGDDDIYKIKELRKLSCEQLLGGTVHDPDKKPVSGANVTLFDTEMIGIQSVKTDKDGRFIFAPVDCGTRYILQISSRDFEPAEMPVTTSKRAGQKELEIQLKTRLVKIKPGDDLASPDVLNIPVIYFDLDQSVITEQAQFELEKILAALNLYPGLKIDVRSHTDSRQTHAYNQSLSDRRAQATINWFIQKGISAQRLSGRGYGESQLANHCADGILCAEAEHKINRRSQFIVLEF